MRATADRLRRVTSTIVRAGGSAIEEADLVATHLVAANLAGHDSHGVGMIPTYVRHMHAGLVVPNTKAKVVKDDGPALMFDGLRGYGRSVAEQAMTAAIARCRQTGVVAMTLANAHHIGRVGAYGEMASGSGLVSLHFVNVTDHRAIVAPFRGTDARFVTNPVCIALPGTERQPALLLDMATSAIAMGKVRVARNEGHEVDDGILIDPEGKPTPRSQRHVRRASRRALCRSAVTRATRWPWSPSSWPARSPGARRSSRPTRGWAASSTTCSPC